MIRKVAQLEARNDGLGFTPAMFESRMQNYADHLAQYYAWPFFQSKPSFTWWEPNVPALIAADGPQIVATIQRDLANAVSPRIWEIGNEPNLFPSISPASYAQLFRAYYRLIKQHDPDAIILCGAVFMTELIEPRDNLIDVLNHRLVKDSWSSGNMINVGTGVVIGALLGGPIGGLIGGLYPSYIIESTKDQVRRTLTSRLFQYASGRDYLSEVVKWFRNNDARMYIDFIFDRTQSGFGNRISVHAYPLDLGTTKTPLQVRTMVQYWMNQYRDEFYYTSSTGVKVYSDHPIWVTEVGNINYKLTPLQVAERFNEVLLVGYNLNTWRLPEAPGAGWANPPAVWLWYKPIGVDHKFAQLLPGRAPPYTRLIEDVNYVSRWPLLPACSQLGIMGRVYSSYTNWLGGRDLSCWDR